MPQRNTPSARELEWDYTRLADAYLARPDYADAAIDRILEITKLKSGARTLDAGAGAGHLTVKLAARGWDVVALEPNAAMRARGVERTRALPNVRWTEGLMQDTGELTGSFDACTFGSSFGVIERSVALREAARILKDDGWVVCVFNHRVLEDPLQREIEDFIRSRIADYSHGPRREDQTGVIAASGLFGPVAFVETSIAHVRPAHEWIEAWRSHATLQRQSGDRFPEIVDGIARLVLRRSPDRVEVPYLTRVWLAQRLPRLAASSATT